MAARNFFKKRLAAATVVMLVFAAGFWAGSHKDAIFAYLPRSHGDLTPTIPFPSPSTGPLTLTESPVEATTQTPASWDSEMSFDPLHSTTVQSSLVDQLLREGIELRDRGDTTGAIDRLQEALDSEPDNPVVLAEIAKTYDLMQLYDRADEVWRKLQKIGPSAGAPYELADRRLKLGAPTPAAAPMPMVSDSSPPKVSTSPTAADFAKNAMTPPEHEIDQGPPVATATASEISSPGTGTSPAESTPSAGTAVAQSGGRLVILRTANFGWNLALNLKIDGKTAGNIVHGSRYDELVPAGRHTLTVSAVPNYQPTSTVVDVQSGQTYVFTATRGQNTDRVVLVPSALP